VYSRVLNGKIWCGLRKQCRKTVSLRKGSLFNKTKLANQTDKYVDEDFRMNFRLMRQQFEVVLTVIEEHQVLG